MKSEGETNHVDSEKQTEGFGGEGVGGWVSLVGGIKEEMYCREHCVWYIYTMEYYSAIRNDKYPPFALTWMELEGIMLSEVSQAEKDNYHMVSLICGK